MCGAVFIGTLVVLLVHGLSGAEPAPRSPSRAEFGEPRKRYGHLLRDLLPDDGCVAWNCGPCARSVGKCCGARAVCGRAGALVRRRSLVVPCGEAIARTINCQNNKTKRKRACRKQVHSTTSSSAPVRPAACSLIG